MKWQMLRRADNQADLAVPLVDHSTTILNIKRRSLIKSWLKNLMTSKLMILSL